ncbi:MAG: hypothetical protein AB8B55_06330 [Mariniblastus sp.]
MRLLFLATTCFVLLLTSVNAEQPVAADYPVESELAVATQDSALMVVADNPKKYTKAKINNEGGQEDWFGKLLKLNPRAKGAIYGGEYVVANPDNVPLVFPEGPIPKGVTPTTPAV